VNVEELIERYAALTLKVGVNLGPGQPLAINCYVEHAPLARALAAEAYRMGARFVDVLYSDQVVRRSHIEAAPEDALGWSPPWLIERLEALRQADGALVSLTGSPDPTLLDRVEGSRVARSRMKALTEATLELTSGGCRWCVLACPNPGWARTVFGEPDLERLWQAIATVVRLEEPDPLGAWRAHLGELERRAGLLNGYRFEALRFRGPGTDLEVGLLPKSRWRSAVQGADSVPFVANMPTEEVFTAPDARRVSGTVAATYPLLLQGRLVEGLRVRFESGRAVELHADEGEALIRAHVASDEGSCRLGEVALVDSSSRVGRTGLVYYDTLLDENAAAHIAFGRAIAETVPEARSLSIEERRARGVNHSSLHTDFMIGSPEVSVAGLTAGGETVSVIEAGVFVLS
jgi:aminopeptidase